MMSTSFQEMFLHSAVICSSIFCKHPFLFSDINFLYNHITLFCFPFYFLNGISYNSAFSFSLLEIRRHSGLNLLLDFPPWNLIYNCSGFISVCFLSCIWLYSALVSLNIKHSNTFLSSNPILTISILSPVFPIDWVK